MHGAVTLESSTSTAAAALKPSLSLLSPAIMSLCGMDVASNKRGGRRSAQHRVCHTIALIFVCIKASRAAACRILPF